MENWRMNGNISPACLSIDLPSFLLSLRNAYSKYNVRAFTRFSWDLQCGFQIVFEIIGIQDHKNTSLSFWRSRFPELYCRIITAQIKRSRLDVQRTFWGKIPYTVEPRTTEYYQWFCQIQFWGLFSNLLPLYHIKVPRAYPKLKDICNKKI